MSRAKRRKCTKVRGMAPEFGVCGLLIVIERKECEGFGGSKLIFCGLCGQLL